MHGTKISLRGAEYTIPSATAADLIALETQVNAVLAIKAYPTAQEWTALGDLLYAAMRAAYPDTTREQVSKLLDAENFEDVIRAVLFGFIALKERRAVEAAKAGKGEG